MADREACTDAVEEEQVTTEETKNGKTIKTTTTTRKTTKGGKEEIETTVEEEEVSEEEEEEDEEQEEEEEEEEDEQEEEEVIDVKKVVVVKKEEEKKQEDGDNESDYEVEEVVEVVEVTESEEEEEEQEQEDVEEVNGEAKVETEEKVETTDSDGVSKKTTVSVENDGTKIIRTTTTIVKGSTAPATVESRELISKLEADNLMEKPQISGSSNTGEEGESLLLPLLQGLLHKNMPPVRNQSNLNSYNISNNNVNNNLKDKNTKDSNNNKINFNAVSSDSSGNSLDGKSGKVGGSKTFLGAELNQSGTFHHVEDSGTESGEDLKLIAAGLRNSMARNVDDDDSNHDIIEDVTLALKRLEASLLDGKDIKLDPSKKSALLTLVGRLQQGLKAPDKIEPTADTSNANDDNADEDEPKRPSRSSQRFAKRRNRANRHTVGVSREELADARRYIEEMVLLENISNCTTPESNPATTPTEPLYAIVKQSSLGNVVGKSTAPQPESVLYRPNQFLPNHLKDSKADGGVQMREKKSNVAQFRQSLSLDAQTSIAVERKNRPLSESYVDVPKQVLGNKPQYSQEQVKDPEKDVIDKKVQEKNLYNKTHHSYQPPWVANFNRAKPNVPSAEAPSPTTDSSKSNKFMNKKMMMKRANTIDIPKPMKYMNDMDTDSDAEENGVCSTKSIGLRGTVQVNIKHKPKQAVPSFEPKTENDHKFLAFIQKQKTHTTTPGWNNPKTGESTGANWTNKFGNIKNTFEAGAVTTQRKPPMPTSSARNFWKKTESTNPAPNPTPRIQQRLKMPSSPVSKIDDKIVKPPWADPAYNSEEVVTGSLRIREPPSPRMHSESPKIFIPKPIPVNKFSHAPMSAFKPVAQPKIEPVQFKPIISEQNPGPTTNGSYSEPLYTYASRPQQSPQRLLYPQNTVNKSPTVSIPWARQPNIGNRVLDKASKIETQQSYSESEYDDHSYGRHRSPQPLSVKPQQNSQIHGSGTLNAPSLVRSFQNAEPSQHPGYDKYNSNVSNYPENDSLVNPNAQPLVLTHETPIISPQTNKQEPLKIFDYPSPSPTTCTTQYEMSDDGMDLSEIMEYKAESKVMQGPVSQQAVTVSSRTSRVGDNLSKDKNTSAAKNLLTTMKDIGSKKGATSPSRPPKSSPAPIYSGFRGSFTDVVFPAEPIDDRSSANQPYQPQYSPMVPESPQAYVPPQSYMPPPPPSQKLYVPPPQPQPHGYVPQSPQQQKPFEQPHSYEPPKQQPYIPTQQQKGPHPYSASIHSASSSTLKPQNYSSSSYQSKSSAPTTPVNEAPQTSYYTQNVVPQGPPSGTQKPSGGYQSQVSQKNTTYQPSWSSTTSQPLSPGTKPYLPVQSSQPMNYQPSWDNQSTQPLSPGKATQPLNTGSQPYTSVQNNQTMKYQPSWDSKTSQPLSPGKTTQPFSPGTKPYAPLQQSSWDNKTNQPVSPGKTIQTSSSGAQSTNYQPSWESTTSQPLSPGKTAQPLNSGAQTTNYQPSWESKTGQPLSSGKATQPLSSGTQPYVQVQNNQIPNYQASWEGKSSQPLAPGNKPYVPAQESQISNYQPSWENKANQPLSPGNQIQIHAQSNQKSTAYQPEIQQQSKTNQQNSNYQSWSYKENQQEKSKNIESSLQTKSAPLGAPSAQKTFKPPESTFTSQQGSQSYNYQQKAASTLYSANMQNRKQETESLQSFSMPNYQKNLTNASVIKQEKEVTETVPVRAESPVKATAPKTDKIPVFKKFGPAQPHSYTPNAYQNPLAPQPKESRNRFQNRVGSATAPRKFSEPEIKFSEFQTKQITQTTQLKLQTESSKFTAPKIVEIPSTPITSKDELPSNVVYNNVGQRPFVRQIEAQQEGDNIVSYRFPIATTRMNALSKSDSWHQICQQSQQPVTKPPSPRSFGAADVQGHQLRRAKSGHSLAVPKLFEAGIDKSQISEKQRTVAAYFSGQKSPSRNSPQNVTESISSTTVQTKQVTATSPTTTMTKKSSINRIKTSSKASISNQNPSSGLARSQTMPHIPNVRLLDESNVEDAFEQILNCS